jgi:hypothetical protein
MLDRTRNRPQPAGAAFGLCAGLALFSLFSCGACGCSSSANAPAGASPTMAVFDTSADLTSPAHFFDFPYPSDSRLKADGTPELSGFPNPTASAVLGGLLAIAGQRRGFPVVPVAYFRFSAPVAAQDVTKTLPAAPATPILLLDVDPMSPERGTLFPTVASTLASDGYVPANVLAVAARPGIVLKPNRKYAFIVQRGLNDATGRPLAVAPPLASLESQTTAGSGLATELAPLWAALPQAHVAVTDVAAATVFTTGDVVADTFDLSTKVLGAYSVDITNITLDPKSATYSGFCALHGQVTYPQFQQGSPPYDTGGSFQIGADGLPVKTRDEVAPITFTIPSAPMPSGGYPVAVFFHGTGGVSDAIVDRGIWRPETDTTHCPEGQMLDTWNGVTGCNTPGQGPGYVLAPHGIAMAASALPLNPQRYPAGANQAFPEYFNINNVASLRDIFRQGVLEQRLFIDALARVSIPPSVLAACAGATLPAGEAAFHFRTDPLLAQGQSMGAMYVNMIGAVEPRIKAVTATGAGGFWSYFILETQFIANIRGNIGLLLALRGDFSFMHPALAAVQTALEPADPIVYMPRVGYDPLPGHASRPIYEPHGEGDSYFPTTVQDAVAMSYRNKEAGAAIWPTMQDALTLENLQGIVPYPVASNLTSMDSSTKYTGAAIQYMGDGIYDPHAIYSQLDAVKYQYGCFFETLVTAGTATIPAPAPLGTPCPH